MTELWIYAILFVSILGHCLAGVLMYRAVNADTGLSITEKNSWRLRALISPALFWYYYKQEKKRRNPQL